MIAFARGIVCDFASTADRHRDAAVVPTGDAALILATIRDGIALAEICSRDALMILSESPQLTASLAFRMCKHRLAL